MTPSQRIRRLSAGRRTWVFITVSDELLSNGGHAFRRYIRESAREAIEDAAGPVGRLIFRLDPWERYGLADAMSAGRGLHVIMAVAGEQRPRRRHHRWRRAHRHRARAARLRRTRLVSLYPRAFDMRRTMERSGLSPARWRCSPDLGGELRRAGTVARAAAADEAPGMPDIGAYTLRAPWQGHPAGFRIVAPPATFMDLPVEVDETLPPNALVLDPSPGPDVVPSAS